MGHRLVSCTPSGELLVQSEASVGGAWRTAAAWSAGGQLSCLAVLRGGSHCAGGGDGREVRVWDVETQQCTFSAKPPAKDWLGMYVHIYCASAAFIGGDGAHTTLLVGGEHEVRLFDFRAQRRAVRLMPLGDKGLISALASSPDGSSFVAGTSRGLLAQFDIASGAKRGALKGATGAVRCLAQHPSLPLVAVTGLDRHVRVFSTETRLQLTALYTKQQGSSIVFDVHSAVKLSAAAVASAEAEATAAVAAAPARKKEKRTGAVLERMSSAARGDAELPLELKPRRKKKRADPPIQLNLAFD